MTGLSTCRGMWKLVENEVVHFCFPKSDVRRRPGNHWVSAKTAAAASEIVRFSTKRSGEVYQLIFMNVCWYESCFNVYFLCFFFHLNLDWEASNGVGAVPNSPCEFIQG